MQDPLRKVRSSFRSPALRAIFRWSKPVRGSVALISLLGVLAALVSLSVTLVTRGLIDGATSGNEGALWLYGGLLVGCSLLGRLLSFFTLRVNAKASIRLQTELQRMVTVSLMGKDYASLKPYHSGELVNRIFSDVSVVKGGMLSLLPTLLRTAVSFIGAAVILVTMDWRFLPVIIGGSCVGVALSLLFREPMKRRHRRMQEAEGALHASTQENIENIRVVKASGSEERALQQIEQRRMSLAQEQMRNSSLSIWMNQGLGSMFDIAWLICNLWGCVKIFQGTSPTAGWRR